MPVTRRKPLSKPVAQPPRMPVEQDADYVGCFQRLAFIGIHVKRHGRSLPLELEKARLDLRVASFHGAQDAAKIATVLDDHCGEAYWLHGMALLGLCMARLDLLDLGPGEAGKQHDDLSAEDYLEDARASIVVCARLSDWRDEEAGELVGYLDTVLAGRIKGPALAKCLRPLVSLLGPARA